MRARSLYRRIGLVAASITVVGGAAWVAPRAASAASGPVNVWPMFHHDQKETGFSPDSLITDTNAPSMGVKWMSSLTTQALSSPVVAWSTKLSKTLVYAGSEAGYLTAFDQASGATVWSDNLGSAVRSSPAVSNGYVWAAPTYAPKLYKIDASTGAVACSVNLTTTAEASPVIATPPGGTPTVYIGLNDLGATSGPIYAISAADCSVKFSVDPYVQESGTWAGMTYATDKNGRGLILFGSADPDARVYAIDAVTGAAVWHYDTPDPSGLADIGSGVTVTAPGVNGFADGVAYVPDKDGFLWALDLTTGLPIWDYPFYAYNGGTEVKGNGSRSTAAIVGTQLVFGTSTGVFALNAKTGSLMWQYPDPAEVLSSVAIIGPSGHRVVVFGDVYGRFQILSDATGQLLYSYQTNNYIAGSVADTDGNLLITSADGFLYDFAPGGGNAPAPSTVVSYPAAGAVVANPNGNLTIQGTASDPSGVAAVDVDVQTDGATGSWWNSSSGTWSSGAVDDPAVLGSAGSTSTTWSISVPMPARGTVVSVQAYAVNRAGIADTTANRAGGGQGRAGFTVAASTTAPTLFATPSRVAPGAVTTVTGGGFSPGESVNISLPARPVVTVTVTAAADGTLPATPVTIPANNSLAPTQQPAFGPISLIATGVTSLRQTSAPLYISNNWDQWRNNPTRTAFEMNDSSLDNNVGANGRSFLNQAWVFPSGAPIHSSVSIDNGVGFFGNDAGDFYALNVVTGAPVWQDNYGAKIDSSAAVDSNLVIVGIGAASGSGSGSVVAMDEATGTVAWQLATPAGVESSPAVYGGVVYVGSDDGTMDALNETTGAVIWTASLGAALHSSPTVIAKLGLVVTGDDSGNVTALQMATGAVAWHDLTGGAVTATPMYFANNIYVGSTDGKEYAMVARTGASVWSFTTGGPITASNVTFGTAVGVGSADGTVYYLDSKAGSLVNSLAGTSPVTGLSGSVNFAVVVTSAGLAEASRVTGTDQTWTCVLTSTGCNPNATGVPIASAPTVLNGTVYITGLDNGLHAFTAPGRPVY